jgi:hypothetical protein
MWRLGRLSREDDEDYKNKGITLISPLTRESGANAGGATALSRKGRGHEISAISFVDAGSN